MALRVSQVGKEVWYSAPGNLRVTQLGNEVWINNSNNSNIRVTQLGKEVWRSTPGPAFGITYQVTNSINLTAT
jgi:hypothetical protein